MNGTYFPAWISFSVLLSACASVRGPGDLNAGRHALIIRGWLEKIRNPNSEVRNKLRTKFQMLKIQNYQIAPHLVWKFFLLWSFEIVSNFGFCASNFGRWQEKMS
jgi:hypothetical protein